MIKQNWKKAVISSLLILSPAVIGLFLWNELPDSMAIHWGADGYVDGFGNKAFAVFGMPVILLAIHWLCLFVENWQKEQNQKVRGIVFWILPIISVFMSGMVYSTALGRTRNLFTFMPLLMGVLFIFLGNYMPKTARNRTFGVKLYWTMANDENWNKTHRMAGKLWVCGGFAILLTVFLPVSWAVAVMTLSLLIMIAAPIVYSYRIYATHKKQGVEYNTKPRTKGEKIATRIAMFATPIILIAIMVLMFSGNIDLQVAQDSFKLEATYWSDINVKYENVDSIELREEKIPGSRVYGFSSARLSLGTFENEAFGTYTRMTYTTCDSCIVLRSGDHVLVISGKDNAETEQWYQQLSEMIS